MAGIVTNEQQGKVRLEALTQLLQLTWDGNLISKQHRDALVEAGYASRINGWNIISENGVILLQNLGVITRG